MSKIRTLLTLAAFILPLSAPVAHADGYTAKMKITEGDDPVTSGTSYAEKGEPVRMGVSYSRQYGGENGPYVESGFRFEMLPERRGDAMHIEINLTRTEVTDSNTGALKQESALIQGEATRDGDGWTYQTDKFPGGKVFRVTLKEADHPEWELPKDK